MHKNIDIAVRDHVMGWVTKPYFKPSSNISDAWQVIERLAELGYETLVRNCISDNCLGIRRGKAQIGDYFCNISKDDSINDLTHYHKAYAKTATLAICLASLKAVGVNIDDIEDYYLTSEIIH